MKKDIGKTRRRLGSLLMLVALGMPSVGWAQQKNISGKVLDSNNKPIAGVTVSVQNAGTRIETTTDADGNYHIVVPEGKTILFKSIGFNAKEELTAGKTTINVVLQSDDTQLETVVVVGYGTQRKQSLTGAVASVKGTEMRQTKNENPQNMLAGRVAGVRVWQKSAEPGAYSANFDVRGLGAPLVVIDGVPRTAEDFQRLNPADIEDVSVLKDASAAIYGVRSANGVVLVTTKKGKEGRTSISYNGSYTFQKPSGMPVLADAISAMTIYNERSMNNINGGSLIYTEKDFEDFRNGTRRSSDWTSLLFSKYSPQTQHDISISGGSNKIQYYIGGGYSYQQGFFKSGDLNYNKYNLRSNINAELAKGLKLELNLSGMADQQNNPYTSSVDIIRNYWKQGMLFPAYADAENTLLNYEGLDLEQNTLAMIDSDISGYRKFKKKTLQSSAALNYDLSNISPILEGFSAKALIGYDYRVDNNALFRKEYYQYAFNKSTGTYDQKLYNLSSPNQMKREFFDKQQLLGQFILNYDRTIAEQHKVSGVIGWETQKNDGDNFYGLKNLAFGSDQLSAGVEDGQMTSMYNGITDYYDEAKSALFGRANYDFGGRYIAEFQFRYDGSSRFAKGHQWGFFPSASVGWRLSEEPFFKSIAGLSFVNQLKFRASYGVLGDDLSSSWDFGWIPGYIYPATSGNAENGYNNQYAPGYIFGGKYITGVSRKPIANELITWYKAKTFNVGMDFEGWNGLFGFTLDYFERTRSGLFQRRTSEFPTVIGATAPLENVNSDRHMGLELELKHRNRINDFAYNIRAIATVTRNKYLTAVQNGPYKNSYDRWRNDNFNNRYQGIQFGYESAGRFESWEDIWSYPIYKERDVLPGDYKYLDWNGDGEINGQDEHPFAFDQTPWLNYSMNIETSYKNFDMSLLLQGSALGSMEYKEPLYAIWGSNGGGTLEQYLDRWHPVDPTADPYDPATEWVKGYYAFTGRYPKSNSEFNRVSTAYLRLKSAELGYTFSNLSASSTMRLRVYANAYNLFTITGVRFVDPEHPDDDLGRMYPLNKTYSLGVSLSF
ncbi:SusC/RagA family TonB-linked outer membrane protein [Sphingobacterium thalpophilum]|uniref:SusC/RagA family TonB-linked outer membrane protein n=1 Tax=Sphingobacterium thalpophilum TaxID=259 RepID=UPI0024A6BEA2|nr:TonB-dependent receptor [Sphingobacterium thalpophilum]